MLAHDAQGLALFFSEIYSALYLARCLACLNWLRTARRILSSRVVFLCSAICKFGLLGRAGCVQTLYHNETPCSEHNLHASTVHLLCTAIVLCRCMYMSCGHFTCSHYLQLSTYCSCCSIRLNACTRLNAAYGVMVRLTFSIFWWLHLMCFESRVDSDAP